MTKKLFVIGNGFDLWCGLPTNFSEFKDYYYKYRDSIMESCNIRYKEIYFENEQIGKFSDVELIYGNPFSIDELDEQFWFNFEESLSDVDDYYINQFFGKEDDNLEELNDCINNAKHILTEAFTSWIKSIHIEKKTSEYIFDESCEFLNFNYTKTLQKYFAIPSERIHFIHGEADDKESIIFGHDSQSEPPPLLAQEFGGRFRGLFHIENLLYETDKHIDENIEMFIIYLSLKGIMPNDIEEVYVLGHSFGNVDFKYFKFLVSATKKSARWHISCYSEEDEKRVNETMDKLGFENYKTYKSIDECIQSFKKTYISKEE